MDHVFVMMPICEKYLVKGEDVNFSFKGLEKEYGMADRDAMWNVLKLYEVGRKMLGVGMGLNVDNKTCEGGRNCAD